MSTISPNMGEIRNRVHELALRIYYEDTDAGGIVYHANFARYFERGRSELLRCLGIDHAAAWMAADAGMRAGFAVRRMDIEFLTPVFLDDALVVHSAVESVGAARVDARQWIMRDGVTVSRARLQIALVDGRGRPKRLPEGWRRKLEAIETGRKREATDTR